MAIVLEANYCKKLGLPGYSSHQYMVSVRSELTDMDQVADESARLYRLLQDSVDVEMQSSGWLPIMRFNQCHDQRAAIRCWRPKSYRRDNEGI